jgi:hypothetical protein
VRRVNRQRRQHRKDIPQKMILQMLEVARGQLGPGQDRDPLGLHLPQLVEHRLLGLHQAPRILVDQRSCSAALRPSSDGVGCLVRTSARNPATRTV